MRTTQEVKAKLTEVETEIKRVNKLLVDDPSIESKQFILRNGQESTVPGMTFDLKLTTLVHERALLKWILNINN